MAGPRPCLPIHGSDIRPASCGEATPIAGAKKDTTTAAVCALVICKTGSMVVVRGRNGTAKTLTCEPDTALRRIWVGACLHILDLTRWDIFIAGAWLNRRLAKRKRLCVPEQVVEAVQVWFANDMSTRERLPCMMPHPKPPDFTASWRSTPLSTTFIPWYAQPASMFAPL